MDQYIYIYSHIHLHIVRYNKYKISVNYLETTNVAQQLVDLVKVKTWHLNVFVVVSFRSSFPICNLQASSSHAFMYVTFFLTTLELTWPVSQLQSSAILPNFLPCTVRRSFSTSRARNRTGNLEEVISDS